MGKILIGVLYFCLFGAVLVITVLVLQGVLKGTKTEQAVTDLVKPLEKVIPRPLDAYTIENLGKRKYTGSEIVFDGEIASEAAYIRRTFHFVSDGKRVSGSAHLPVAGERFGVVVQLRGYVDRTIYQPGVGTARSGAYFAEHGFLALAPDFLGYGTSDPGADDIFENRFETYTTVMNLLASVASLQSADPDNTFLWGHSNGGHIGLTALEIYDEATKSSEFPLIRAATFWAPVTKPFPYSILYYTDEAEDEGKYMRKELAGFEAVYDVQSYSMPRYADRISVPMTIHQGFADEAVPERWSRDFVLRLRDAGKSVEYYPYPGADHNLAGAWDTAVARDVEFFRSFIE